MKLFTKLILILLLALVLLIVPRIGGWIADLFSYQNIDPDGAFMWISVHHIVKAIVILLLMFLFTKATKIRFNLGFGNKLEGKKYVNRFMIFFTVYAFIAFIISILSGDFQPFGYPLNARNITGYLGFQLLLSGPSEELIFRAFSISMFVFFISDRRLNKHISYAVLFSAIMFGIAHVSFSFNPFSLSYSIFQVGYAMVLGYFYGNCYEKTESVIYPMIMHSFANVVMMGLTVLISIFI